MQIRPVGPAAGLHGDPLADGGHPARQDDGVDPRQLASRRIEPFGKLTDRGIAELGEARCVSDGAYPPRSSLSRSCAFSARSAASSRCSGARCGSSSAALNRVVMCCGQFQSNASTVTRTARSTTAS